MRLRIQIRNRLRGTVLLAGLLAGLIPPSGPAAADLKTGVTAYRAGDYKTALREFSKLAEAGEPNGQFNLAVLYLSGRGVERDVAKAVHWHRKAAAQGLTAAEHGLGVFYYQGMGVKQDYAEALNWFRRAAAKGFAESEFNLGVMYFNREGVTRDDREVVKWVALAAGRKFAPAQYRMGQMYEQGVIFAKNLKAALHWYRQAEKRGNRHAPGARARVARLLDAEAPTRATAKNAKTAPRKAVPKRNLKKAAAETTTSGLVKTPKPKRKPPIPAAPSVVTAGPLPKAPSEVQTAPRPDPQVAQNIIAKTAAKTAPIVAPAHPKPTRTIPVLRSDGWKNPFSLTPPSRPALKPAVETRELPRRTATASTNSTPATAQSTSSAADITGTKSRPTTTPDAREWRVQFAAFRTADEAKRAMATLNAKAGAAIGRIPRIIAVADLGPRGIYHRVQAGPVEDAQAAANLCALVKAVLPKQACVPVRARGS